MENVSKPQTTKKVGELTVDNVYKADFQKKGTVTVQLRQEVTIKTVYPGIRVNNELQDNPFSVNEFAVKGKEFENTEKRVAWINVPEGVSKEDVEGRLPKEACLYRILSNYPIITSNQKDAIANGVGNISEESIADKQVIRYPDNSPYAGQLVLREGKPQYRAVFYSNTHKDDVDKRDSSPEYFATPLIKAEISGSNALIGQALQEEEVN